MKSEVMLSQLEFNPFSMIGQEGFLISAARGGRVALMTAGWGLMGILWGKPVVTVYVRPSRYTYDALNRMTSATDRRGETTEYTYDLAGNVVRIDRPNNTYTTIEYNDMDQVTKLVNYSKGKILSSFQYEYDLSGFIVKEIASQDKEETVTSTYAYDYRCQLVRVRMTTESGPVIEREYAYDKAGNRIMEETTSDGVVIRRVESEYDDASRLISQNIWEDSAPGHSGDKPEKPEKPHTDNGHHYGNDKGDNHIDKKGQQKKEDISSNADNQEAIANNTAELLPPDVYDSGVEAWSGKHDPDQTISYQYDENGNLTEKSGSDIDTFSYQYDNENRLRAVMQNGTVLMAALYDGNGDRIFKLQRHSTSGNVPSSEEKKNNGNNKNKDKDKNNGNQGSSTNGDVPVDLALLEDVMLLPTGANKINIESFDLTGYINDVNRQYTQALMEYGKNGKYNSIYSYGLQRLGADYSTPTASIPTCSCTTAKPPTSPPACSTCAPGTMIRKWVDLCRRIRCWEALPVR